MARTRDQLRTAILTIGLCAIVCEGEGWTDMALFGRAREGWRRTFLAQPNRIPSHASDGAALREVLPSVEHRQHQGLHNRAENAHQPTRERERRLRRCKRPGHAQRFLAAAGPIAGHYRPRRHRLAAAAYRETRHERCATWRAVTGTPALA